jgi:hypothetical protein
VLFQQQSAPLGLGTGEDQMLGVTVSAWPAPFVSSDVLDDRTADDA